MAEYQLTPYRVSITPVGDPNSPRKMGEPSLVKKISTLDAVANTWATLSREPEPRQRPDDKTRLLDFAGVAKVSHQVQCSCRLGVSGYTSNLQLAALQDHDIEAAVRAYNDPEWFDLRLLFAAAPSARAGILLVESVGNYGIAKHSVDLLKAAIRQNVDQNVIVRVEPVQEALTLGQSIATLQTQSLEFRTVVQSSDDAQNQAHGGEIQKFNKVVKIKKRGGLGAFAQFKGKSAKDISAIYGFFTDGEITDKTTVSATVLMPNGNPRKVSVEEGMPASISFPIHRTSNQRPPSDEEFYRAVEDVISEVKNGLALGMLNIVDPSTVPSVDSCDDAPEDWLVTDEGASV